jgi:hypothetical protein
MERSPRVALMGVALLLAAGASLLLTGANGRATSEPGGKCCFTNPRYSGVCEVTPEEDETCASVLAYLNNPNSMGKDYCGNTTIRGGWEEVACESD